MGKLFDIIWVSRKIGNKVIFGKVVKIVLK